MSKRMTALITGLTMLLFLGWPQLSHGQSTEATERAGRTEQPRPGKRFQRIKEARQSFLTEKMELTEAEAAQFFPVFWDFEKRLKQTRQKLFRGNRNKRDQAALNITETEARRILADNLDAERNMINIRREAMEAYLDLIPATKLLKLEPAERAFRKQLVNRVRNFRDGGNRPRRNGF
ncbi:MAG: hypothetical protein AAF828_10925 [Bacteroidota bacterium]